MLIGYARVSGDGHDLDGQRKALGRLGVADEQLFVDKGLVGSRTRPGLRDALAALSSGDTFVVTDLVRLARSLTDACELIDELANRQVKLKIDGALHDPSDPNGAHLFGALAMICDFEVELRKIRSREGMRMARERARLRGQEPALSEHQEAELVALDRAGTHTKEELAELFSVARSTVYRATKRAR